MQWEENNKDNGFVFTNSIVDSLHTSKINEKLADTVQFFKDNDK